MFNLFRSNAKITRFLLGGLLLIVAASMVTYLIPSSGLTSATSTSDGVIADVGGARITADEAKEQVDRLVAGGRLPREAGHAYLTRLLVQMVSERAVRYSV